MNAEQVGKQAALLSIIEIGLGSVLHGLQIPMAGHLLSLNQGFILSRSLYILQDKRAPGLISTTAALLKSLSPAGKKLTPMLAIAVQGQLFGVGPMILGNTVWGHFLGMILLCLWGFIQPLIFYALTFGEALLLMANYYLMQLGLSELSSRSTILWIVVGLVGLKILIGFRLVLLARRFSSQSLKRYEEWATKQNKPMKKRPAASNVFVAAFRDLMTPFFIVTLLLTIFFFVFAKSSYSTLIWNVLRPVAIGYIIFLLLRLIDLKTAQKKLAERNPFLAESLAIAIKIIHPSGSDDRGSSD